MRQVNSKFKREKRYYVIKVTDVEKYLSLEDEMVLDNLMQLIDECRVIDRKPPLECVVVESDWPEYDVVWDMIEQRVQEDEE